MVLEHSAQRGLAALQGSICLSCRAAQSLARPSLFSTTTTTTAPRAFSTTARRGAANDPPSASTLSAAWRTPGRPQSTFSASDALAPKGNALNPGDASITAEPEPHHLHINASKHNTHLTLTRPDRNPIISVAAGNIGFRKAGRGSYDAAYQLTAFLLSTIQDRGLLREIKNLELIFSGFGDGREAVKKAIMGNEGMNIRNRIVRVTDATKLKFGGARSKKPRRLG